MPSQEIRICQTINQANKQPIQQTVNHKPIKRSNNQTRNNHARQEMCLYERRTIGQILRCALMVPWSVKKTWLLISQTAHWVAHSRFIQIYKTSSVSDDRPMGQINRSIIWNTVVINLIRWRYVNAIENFWFVVWIRVTARYSQLISHQTNLSLQQLIEESSAWSFWIWFCLISSRCKAGFDNLCRRTSNRRSVEYSIDVKPLLFDGSV